MTITAIIVAAGKGERAGGPVPKQYAMVGGKSLLAHAVMAFSSHQSIDQIIVVIGEGQSDLAREALGEVAGLRIITGGAERQDSVAAGIAAAGDADILLIHDAARPFLPHTVINRLIEAMETSDGAVPALPVADTLSRGNQHLGDVVDRTNLYRIQTPQAFRAEAIKTAHSQWRGPVATDDAQMARAAGYRVALVAGDIMLEKVTTPQDFAEAERRISARLISRSALGFDVHQLASGEELWLGGVRIDHDKGLVGHSDADVALHALTDALLGALGDGDIGTHFPPSDPQWRGARSQRFVEHAAQLVSAAGGIIDHVDLTLICEAPKIGPHKDAMRAAIANMLGISVRHVSVKATTTERLGFTGRGEGIAAQAIATIRLPEGN
ncbi:MAG: bifunctional 2-C-methyl-D-erythritol 4-phosphate cytidylyltransferase/2-C-methyl-D-erythritol 2,4-cyclodiphosphate synthase [Sphingomonadaceae bacterium]|nr:bifunctional 2-C-methyl-D-erythritol 4-phosphate cytidylyltransferase/2-C-methyl-D-erythritol 2,4-cyclodiphosphate synthase [Sphingomonadaceae bacterium]